MSAQAAAVTTPPVADAGQADDPVRADRLDRVGDHLPDARCTRRWRPARSRRRAPSRSGRSRRGRAPGPAWGRTPSRSRTWTSRPCIVAARAASRPIGPAPVTSTVRGSQNERRPMIATCSRALVITVVGSRRTPRSPRLGSTLIGVLRLDPPALGHVAVDLLDPALGVLAVAAHVPLADGAVGAGDRVRAADDPHHQVALLQGARRARVEDAAERLVAQHQARRARGRPAVLALDDLDVGPADPDGDRLDEDRALVDLGLRDLFAAGGSRLHRLDGDGFHSLAPFLRRARRQPSGPVRSAILPNVRRPSSAMRMAMMNERSQGL